MTTLTQITVPFHNAELYLVEHDGQPYTPMKPIVEGMGLAWQSQLAKTECQSSTMGYNENRYTYSWRLTGNGLSTTKKTSCLAHHHQS